MIFGACVMVGSLAFVLGVILGRNQQNAEVQSLRDALDEKQDELHRRHGPVLITFHSTGDAT